MKKIITMLMASLLTVGSASALDVQVLNPVKKGFGNSAQHIESYNGTVKYTPAKKATRADEETLAKGNFTYNTGLYSFLTLNGAQGTTAGKTRVYMGFEFQPEDLANFADGKITAIDLYSGVTSGTVTKNPVTSMTLYIAEELGGDPVVTQEVKLGTNGQTNYSFDLETPYEIKDATKPIYVLASYLMPAAGYYIPIDGVPTDFLESNLVALTNATTMPTSNDYYSFADLYGAVCMGCTIECAELPQNQARILDWVFPSNVQPEKEFEGKILVQNFGYNNIESMEITTSIAGEEDIVYTCNLSKALIPGDGVAIDLTGLKIKNNGEYTIVSKVTKVNGKEFNRTTQNATNSTILVFSDGYDRNVVFEDATGTWCGWCPGGMEMLEYVKSRYYDRGITIGVHSGDALASATYAGLVQDYVSGFPCVIVNRADTYTPTQALPTIKTVVDEYMKTFTSEPTFVKVELDTLRVDAKTMNVKAKTTFAIDVKNQYMLSFVLVNDWSKALKQSNYFAKGQQGNSIPMGDWNSKSTEVLTRYTDVAEYITSYPGIKNSLPAQCAAGEEYNYDLDMDISGVGTRGRIVALVTDANTGEIVNANQVRFGDWTAVNEVNADSNVVIEGGKGAINVVGANNVEAYSLDGVRVALTGLTPGLYVVKADGKTAKVLVK